MRRSYLDWMRGLAVLIMIEAHVIDSWTRTADRHTWKFGWSLILGGFGAPFFLFLAGVSVALSAGSKARRSGDPRAAAAAVERRGLEIFLLAFLFRVQAWVISRSAAIAMLRVDILNIMGPAIIGTAMLWGALRTQRPRIAALSAATVVLVFATPIVRASLLVAALPDFLEAYIRPVPVISNFTFFPWAAFVPAGAVVGVFIDEARTGEDERKVNLGLAIAGILLAWGSYQASLFPSVFGTYAKSSFWTSSPAFFFLRLGLISATVALAYLWEQRPSAGRRLSPMRVLGRSSLFIYWIHVEMVYGIVSIPLHHGLTLGEAWAGFGVFCLFMLVCAVAKQRLLSWWNGPRRHASVSGPSTVPG